MSESSAFTGSRSVQTNSKVRILGDVPLVPSSTPTRDRTRKWFELPPRGIGKSRAHKPGLITSNNIAYSIAKSLDSHGFAVIPDGETRLKTIQVFVGGKT